MNTTIDTSLLERIYDTLHKSLGFPRYGNAARVSIAPDEKREVDYYQPVWLMGGKAIIAASPAHIERMQALISDTDLTPASISTALGHGGHEIVQMMFYALSAEHFKPFAPDSRYSVRQLSHDDEEAFAAFQAACSEDDRETGEVGLGDEVIFGVLDGEKIVAAASTYELWDFVDMGVLTHPDYRKQGLGKAAVSALCEHYLQRKDDSRVKLYRHEATNYGSQGIARGLNWQLFATLIYVKFLSISNRERKQ